MYVMSILIVINYGLFIRYATTLLYINYLSNNTLNLVSVKTHHFSQQKVFEGENGVI